jgi:2-polyprenyl-6-methoxyphenol hydroxylase-like FAD-dependent oxidoreductase
MIDGRGRKFTVPHGLSDAMSAAAVTIDGLNVTVIAPDGTTKTRSEGKVQEDIFFQLIPRARLLQVFAAGLESDPAAQAAVKIRTGVRCAAVDKQPDGRIAVTLKPSSKDQRGGAMPPPTAANPSSSSTQPGASAGGQPRPGNIVAAAASLAPAVERPVEGTLRPAESSAAAAAAEPDVLYPRLLLACDGIHSSVRGALSSWAPTTYTTSSFPSLSSGMRFKILQLPPNPVTKNGLVLQNDKIWVLEGAPCASLPGYPPLRLGMWPLKDPTAGRTANLNTLPHHPIWDITDPEEMYAVLGESFPQLDWRQAVPPEVRVGMAQRGEGGGVLQSQVQGEGVFVTAASAVTRFVALTQRQGTLWLWDWKEGRVLPVHQTYIQGCTGVQTLRH